MMIRNNKVYASGGQGALLKNRPLDPHKTFDKARDQDDAKRRDGPKGLLWLPAPRGRVLRVKQGYNPNSSSMGSIVFVLPAFLFVVTVIFGALSGLLAPLLLRKIENPGKKIEQFYLRMQNTFFKKKMKGNKQ